MNICKYYSLAIVLLIGCSSQKQCPTEQQESVSLCRAEVACGKGSFGTSMGMIFSGMGSGLSHQGNAAQNNYNRCIDNQLSAQRSNAGIESREIRCESSPDGSGGFTTACRQ